MKDLLKISFAGDIMCLKEQIKNVGNTQDIADTFNYALDAVRPFFKDSDYVIGNLETPVCSEPLSDAEICFNTPVEFVNSVYRCGFDFVSTANNHCLDRNIKGIDETIDNIEATGLEHSGTYKTKEDSETIFIKELDGIRIAIICATFGTNSEYNGILLSENESYKVDLLKKQNKPARARFNPKGDEGRKIIVDNVSSAAITNRNNLQYTDKLLSKIRKAKQMADIVIVMPHIGGQYNPAPGTYTKYIADAIAAENPSIIVAGHPHVPLRAEIINNVFTAYSLGNFCFTPGVGYFIPNVLAEYGIVLHTYWDKETKTLAKATFSVVVNTIDDNGIAVTLPVQELYSRLQSAIDKDRLLMENEAVVNRFVGGRSRVPIQDEYDFR